MMGLLNICIYLIGFTGVVYAIGILATNVILKSELTTLSARNKSMNKIISSTMIYSYVLNFVACVISDSENIYQAMDDAAKRYTNFVIAWLCVLAAIAVAYFILAVFGKRFNETVRLCLKQLAGKTIVAAAVGFGLSWLLTVS